MQYSFYTADVFTQQIFGGNPLAVFPQAGGLSETQMQAIAGEFNLSETAFVLPPETPQGTARLRIFTPRTELPFAGHPTVGTACVLATAGRLPLNEGEAQVVLEEGVGPVRVDIRAGAGQPLFARLWAARLPEFGPPPPSNAELAAMLSLEPEDLLEGRYAPEAVSCGGPFLFVPLASLEALGRARVVQSLWERTLSGYWATEVYLLTFETGESRAGLRARMFAPAMGIGEDPATGAAATAIAGYLGKRQEAAGGLLRWTIAQGVEMGRPSLLEVEADCSGGEIRAIRVGGSAVLVSQGTMEVPG